MAARPLVAAAFAGASALACAGRMQDPVLPCPGGFDATFIQLGERELAHDVPDWRDDLELLRAIGIRRILLQYSGDERGAFDERAVGRAPVRSLLEAATELEMSVLVGLYFDPRWPNAFPIQSGMPPPLDRPAEMQRLWSLCAFSPACTGWYLPSEFDDRTWSGADRTPLARAFIARSAGALRRMSPNLDVAIAPFFTGALDPDAHARWWSELLADRQISVFLLQDGVGSGHGTAESAASMLGALEPVTSVMGIRLWSTVETFHQVHGAPRDALPFAAVPASFDDVLRSIELEGFSGARLAAFTVLDYMDPRRGGAAAELYSRYAAHCKEARSRIPK
jgi:hypothetical protein